MNILNRIREEVEVIRDRDPAARNSVEILLTYSGLHAVLAYRLSHKLLLHHKPTLARIVSQTARFFTGIEIHPGARIGRRLFIDHGMGVVIGETAVVGDDCTIYQGVTLGGTGKDHGKRHPSLGNNVTVGSGAKVLGPFHVGDNAKIAAGAVVLKEVPANATAVGVPARVVRMNGVRVQDLDQINIPDPVAAQLSELTTRIEVLEARTAAQEKTKRAPRRKKTES